MLRDLVINLHTIPCIKVFTRILRTGWLMKPNVFSLLPVFKIYHDQMYPKLFHLEIILSNRAFESAKSSQFLSERMFGFSH